METFGGFIKTKRIEKKMTLREFCKRTKVDPSNWSKIERGLLAPPKSKEVLGRIADILGIKQETEEWYTLSDLAVVAHVPAELLADQTLVNSLPIFFRTIRGQTPTEEELLDLVEMIRSA